MLSVFCVNDDRRHHIRQGSYDLINKASCCTAERLPGKNNSISQLQVELHELRCKQLQNRLHPRILNSRQRIELMWWTGFLSKRFAVLSEFLKEKMACYSIEYQRCQFWSTYCEWVSLGLWLYPATSIVHRMSSSHGKRKLQRTKLLGKRMKNLEEKCFQSHPDGHFVFFKFWISEIIITKTLGPSRL